MHHDRLFKELLTTFFVEFLDLFFPELVEELDRDSIEFLDKEIFTDVTRGDRHAVDLVAKARFRGQPSCFLIHVEHQAQPQSDFASRMFAYFARLLEKYALPIYPIALFSYDQPDRPEPDVFRMRICDLDVLRFAYRVIQLNLLDWREFVERSNPLSASLMAKMRMEPADRSIVKLACLTLLARLQLDPARRALISGFVDTYLRLTITEEEIFQMELAKVEPEEREQVMEIVTSWMQQGLEQGLAQGKATEAQFLILQLLGKRFGRLEGALEPRIASLPVEKLEQLAVDLLDFQALTDLTAWLDAKR